MRLARPGRRMVLFAALGVACFGLLLACNGRQIALEDPAPNVVRIATYNVHYIILGRETGPWSVGDWDRRKAPMAAALADMRADIIGFQEMESFARGSGGQVNLARDWLLDQHPDYRAAATGDPANFPTTQPIFYRQARFDLLDQGWFFFSQTPDRIYARTFNGSFPAFASWAEFQDKRSQARFVVVNIHTDYASAGNRDKTADLVIDRLSPRIAAGETVFLLGDFNALRGAPTMRRYQAAGFQFAYARGSTYHLNRGLNLFGAIDHIGATDNVVVRTRPVALRRRYDGQWPSDHYPVAGDFILP